MSTNEMIANIKELKSLQALIEEAEAEAEAIKDALKSAMGDREEVRAGEYKVTYKSVTSVRIDTTALKKAMPDIVEAFTKENTTRRFSIA